MTKEYKFDIMGYSDEDYAYWDSLTDDELRDILNNENFHINDYPGKCGTPFKIKLNSDNLSGFIGLPLPKGAEGLTIDEVRMRFPEYYNACCKLLFGDKDSGDS